MSVAWEIRDQAQNALDDTIMIIDASAPTLKRL